MDAVIWESLFETCANVCDFCACSQASSQASGEIEKEKDLTDKFKRHEMFRTEEKILSFVNSDGGHIPKLGEGDQIIRDAA